MLLTILNVGMAASNEITPVAANLGASGSSLFDKVALALAAALCISLGVLGTSKAMGRIAKAALEGTARQPEMSGKLFTTMLIGMALVEALAIYCLLIAFMLIGKM